MDRLLTTNLVYQTPELLSRPYYINVDMSKYIALIIDNLNHDYSISEFLTPTERINRFLDETSGQDRRRRKRPQAQVRRNRKLSGT
jgi:ribose-phosphate pyrophosphokinase